MQAQLHAHRGRDRILRGHLDPNGVSLGPRRHNSLRVESGHPDVLAAGQYQAPLVHVGAGLDGAIELFGKNTGATQMPKLTGPHVPHFPQSEPRGTRLPVAARSSPSHFACRHGAGRLFRSGQAEGRRAEEQRPIRFEPLEALAGQSILLFRRLPRRGADHAASAFRFDHGSFRYPPKSPVQYAHLNVSALNDLFRPRYQRLCDWFSPVRSASVGDEYEKLRRAIGDAPFTYECAVVAISEDPRKLAQGTASVGEHRSADRISGTEPEAHFFRRFHVPEFRRPACVSRQQKVF